MKTSTIVGVLAVLFLVLGGWYWWSLNGGPAMPGITQPSMQACTMEAMVCPDGSAVGRTGPNCAFAPCPTPATAQTQTTVTPTNPAPLGDTGTAADDPGLGDGSAPQQ